MAAKKFYAVKKGKVTGVFENWKDCKTSVDGFSGADYKGFSTWEEACAYAGVEQSAGRVNRPLEMRQETAELSHGMPSEKQPEQPHGTPVEKQLKKQANAGNSRPLAGEKAEELPTEGTLLAYVDGSYDDTLKKYAFGCVFILPDGRIFTEYGNGDNPESLQHRNVTGEMLGAMYAVKSAMTNGYSRVEIRYDYEGIEKWVTGQWRSKTELTRKYAQAMRGWQQDIKILFTKVPAHSNVKYNELADRTAKRGLTEGAGVPKLKKLEEMECYAAERA